MPRKFLKYKLLLDEGFLFRTRLPILNSRFNVKHILGDLKTEGLPDREVYQIALSQKRLLVTFNSRDFKQFASLSKDSGVIGISQELPKDQIDKKLTALLMRSKPSDLYGKFTAITGELSP